MIFVIGGVPACRGVSKTNIARYVNISLFDRCRCSCLSPERDVHFFRFPRQVASLSHYTLYIFIRSHPHFALFSPRPLVGTQGLFFAGWRHHFLCIFNHHVIQRYCSEGNSVVCGTTSVADDSVSNISCVSPVSQLTQQRFINSLCSRNYNFGVVIDWSACKSIRNVYKSREAHAYTTVLVHYLARMCLWLITQINFGYGLCLYMYVYFL